MLCSGNKFLSLTVDFSKGYLQYVIWMPYKMWVNGGDTMFFVAGSAAVVRLILSNPDWSRQSQIGIKPTVLSHASSFRNSSFQFYCICVVETLCGCKMLRFQKLQTINTLSNMVFLSCTLYAFPVLVETWNYVGVGNSWFLNVMGSEAF